LLVLLAWNNRHRLCDLDIVVLPDAFFPGFLPTPRGSAQVAATVEQFSLALAEKDFFTVDLQNGIVRFSSVVEGQTFVQLQLLLLIDDDLLDSVDAKALGSVIYIDVNPCRTYNLDVEVGGAVGFLRGEDRVLEDDQQ